MTTTKFKKHDRVRILFESSPFHLVVGKITHVSALDGEMNDYYVSFGADDWADGAWFYENELEYYLNGIERMIECLK